MDTLLASVSAAKRPLWEFWMASPAGTLVALAARMLTTRSLTLLMSASLLASSVGCEVEESTGDEQNQTEESWKSATIASGPNPFDVTGQDRVAATSKDGVVYAAYPDASRHLTLATRAKGSSSWQTEVVKSDGETGSYASIAVEGNGTVHVVHYDRNASGLMHSIRKGTAWTHTLIGDDLADNRLVRASDGSLHLAALAWDEASRSDTLSYGKYTGDKWAMEPVGVGNSLSSPSLTLDELGAPHVVAWQYADGSFKEGKLVLAARGSTAWKSETLSFPASHTADILVKSGTTHIVYVAPNSKGIFYATRETGKEWSTPETIANWSGWDPDLEFDTKGSLHLVYSSDGDIAYAARGSSGNWTRAEVASGGGGFIAPSFLPGGGKELVFTDWGRRSFRVASFGAQ